MVFRAVRVAVIVAVLVVDAVVQHPPQRRPSRLHTPHRMSTRSSHFGTSTARCVSIRWYARLIPMDPKMKLPTRSDATPHHVNPYGRNANNARVWITIRVTKNPAIRFGRRLFTAGATA
jgi:hypothetical protein